MRQATSAGYLGEGSPNRLDALVWALSDLFLGEETAGSAFLELARREVAAEANRAAPLDVGCDLAPGSVEWARANGPGD